MNFKNFFLGGVLFCFVWFKRVILYPLVISNITFNFFYFQHSGKSNKCVFQEIITEDKFTKFQSVANPLWYIGFRKNGKPLKGYQWTSESKRQCYQFLKTDFPYADIQHPQGPIWGPRVNFKKLVTQLWSQELDKTWPQRYGSSLS